MKVRRLARARRRGPRRRSALGGLAVAAQGHGPRLGEVVPVGLRPAADEAESTSSACCVVTLHGDNSVSVADNGRGTDTRSGECVNLNWPHCGARSDVDPGAVDPDDARAMCAVLRGWPGDGS